MIQYSFVSLIVMAVGKHTKRAKATTYDESSGNKIVSLDFQSLHR